LPQNSNVGKFLLFFIPFNIPEWVGDGARELWL
jgi:hypothetical protein